MAASAPQITALRGAGKRVFVELDGRPWRELPAPAIVAAGLDVGTRLDRPRARLLRRALVEHRLTATAGRALEQRALSRRQLAARLERTGLPPAARRDLVERLGAAGLLDDERLAREYAAGLGSRGWGNEAISARLEQRGIPDELARAAVATLAPEPERATLVLAGARDAGLRRQSALLARRGFAQGTIEQVVGWESTT